MAEGVEKLALALRKGVPGLRASADAADRTLYARDLWPRHHLEVRAGRAPAHGPGVIAWPATAEEVAKLVRWARREGTPLVPFGAGSGVCAGVLPREDAIVVDLKRLTRVRCIAPEAPSIEVEAGHIGLPLEQTLERSGFTLGHFPSSILCSTVGGWVAARSAGQCSSAYGKIEDMVAALECVTGHGETLVLRRRTSDADLTPLLVGSEGTLGIVTAATLRLHPAPEGRSFGAWSFPSVEHGIDAMRTLLQAGLRPAVLRLYDPFDAMLARRTRGHGTPASPREDALRPSGLAGIALRALLGRPRALNEILTLRATDRLLGGALLITIFEGTREATQSGLARARHMLGPMLGTWKGEAPARHWLEHRYAVSYRQAPMFANGAFVDTFEVAAPWSKLAPVYHAVRDSLGHHAFVMAHFSHGYPDGCCIYFSFAGSADGRLAGKIGWDAACETTYDRAWQVALEAAVEAGGTLAHHHGVGRSKASHLHAELGAGGISIARAVARAFDPSGIMNPGNLLPPSRTPSRARTDALSQVAKPGMHVDRESLLARVEGTILLEQAERGLQERGLTLDVRMDAETRTLSVGEWLARGAPGARDAWLDPADHLLAGLDATITGGKRLSIRPAPRRSIGPDLTALVVGARGRFGLVDRAWLRVHPLASDRPVAPPFSAERDLPLESSEGDLLDAIGRALEQAD